MGVLKYRRRGSDGDLTRNNSIQGFVSQESQDDSDMFSPSNGRRSLKKDFSIDCSAMRLTFWGVVFAMSLLIVKYLDGRLPQVVRISDLQSDTEDLRFSEEHARLDLELMTSIGPRISGSEATDILTVNNFIQLLAEIQQKVAENYTLEVQVQRPSGAFFMDWDEGQMSVYQNISNVVARLSPANGDPAAKSVLFNCHFDSKPASPGATDNMISCVTMLEIIRRISSQSTFMLTNPLVFLFNGAEELGLQGAHGFLKGSTAASSSGHLFSKNLACFVNLEGAGGGGREILFQSGPGNGWILEAYRKAAVHPYGIVLAEEAFQNELIPSDTDFRIFRDFGDIPGLDMAFIKNGWVYHTKWDRVIEIPAGSLQNMGDNALALAKHLGTMDFADVKITSTESPGENMVFFDIFGLFMISYSETAAICMNFIFAILFTFATVVDAKVSKPNKLLTLLWMPLSTILSWGCGIAISVFVGAFFNMTGYKKPFYSYPTLAILLYGLPALLTQSLVMSFAWRGNWHRAWLATKFTFAILLFVMTYITRSSYLFNYQIVFAILYWLLHFFLFQRLKAPRAAAFANILVSELFPLMYSLYVTVTLVDVFVPIMGRSGPETNSNIYMGVIMGAILCAVVFNGAAAHLVPYKKIHLVVGLLFSVFFLNPLIIRGFIGGVPYLEKTPMRIQVLDVDRTWYDQNMAENQSDSGYWFWPTDGDTAHFMPILAETNPMLSNFTELDANQQDCSDLYCNMPFFWPTFNSIKKTPWVSKTFGFPYSIKDQVSLEILEKVESDTGVNLTLRTRGPTQQSIVLSPGSNYELTRWSLSDPVPRPGELQFRERPTYFLFLGKGNLASEDFTFKVELQNSTAGSGELLHVMLAGHFMHKEQNAITPEFQLLVDRLPSWTTVSYWSVVLKQFVI